MTQHICPFSKICKLFNNQILDNNSEDIYKQIYCQTNKFEECKRYIIFNLTGECADFIMPNSNYEVDTLIKQQEEEKELFEKLNIYNH